jgi:FtsH-binding integral membrane protein
MTVSDFIKILVDVIVNPLIRLSFAVALVVFLWGVFGYIKNADSSEDRKKGTQHIIWGLVGLFIMTSVFTILEIALNTFGI